MSEVRLRMGTEKEKSGVVSRVQNETGKGEAGKVKTCKRGHEKTPENRTSTGKCRICRRENEKGRYHRYTEKLKQKGARSYQKNKNERLAHVLIFRADNNIKIKADKKASVETLDDKYVLNKLGLSKKTVTADMIEIKRLTIQLQRSIKNGNQI